MFQSGVNGWLLLQSKTGALEGPEVDGFVKDMMELVRVSGLIITPVCVCENLEQWNRCPRGMLNFHSSLHLHLFNTL